MCDDEFFQCPYINGSPQNTFVPGVIKLACERGVPIGGDDFKSGQTKLKGPLSYYVSKNLGFFNPLPLCHCNTRNISGLSSPFGIHFTFQCGRHKRMVSKSVLVDFLVGAGIKPTSIVSYNHLGNNDGKNLSAPAQFRYIAIRIE